MIKELEFTPWPKTFRMNRDVIVTEKIDGSNAAVKVIDAALIPDLPDSWDDGSPDDCVACRRKLEKR